MKSILDKTFVYVPAHKTNIRETFKRFAAPQPSTATGFAAPSKEGVGQGDVAVAAPIPLRRKLGMG
jgi:hypothetical protein